MKISMRLRFLLGSVAAFGLAASADAQDAADLLMDQPSWEFLLDAQEDLPYPNARQPVGPSVPLNVPQPPAAAQANRPVQAARPPQAAGVPRNVQNLLDFYGGNTSGRALSQLPQRPSSGATAPPRARQVAKPFGGRVADPTLSPYLNLYREEDSATLPNYHMFVRPQLRQQETNRRQQRELSNIQNRLQTVTYGTNGPSSAGAPATGHSTRYFNTSRYFPSTNAPR